MKLSRCRGYNSPGLTEFICSEADKVINMKRQNDSAVSMSRLSDENIAQVAIYCQQI